MDGGKLQKKLTEVEIGPLKPLPFFSRLSFAYRFPNIQIILIKKMEECPICFKQDLQYNLTCGHRFCMKCIFDWVTTYKSNCPMCRSNVTEVIRYNSNIVAFPTCKEIGFTIHHGCPCIECICVKTSKHGLFRNFHIICVDGISNITNLLKIKEVVELVRREHRMCSIMFADECPMCC